MIIKCIGYSQYKCGKRVWCERSNKKRCSDCKRKMNTAQSGMWKKTHPEHKSVSSHRYLIFMSKNPLHANYKGMPFFDEWNPKKGGSTEAGAKWIIANLGKRPEGSTLHIIDHEKGFVPGNLEWAYPRKQSNQQMFKIIAQLRHRIKELEVKLRRK